MLSEWESICAWVLSFNGQNLLFGYTDKNKLLPMSHLVFDL